MGRWIGLCSGMTVILALGAGRSAAQIPQEFTNLQVLPDDISRGELVQVMRGFSLATGLRCQDCHTGGDGQSFEGVDFADDGDEDKRKARYMLTMVREINESFLADLPDRDDPPVEIGCKSCHRGQPRPLLLTQDLRIALDEGGVEAMASRYRALRENFGMAGAFDFREWEVNTLGEALAAEGRPGHAAAVYELNAEFHPESVAIQGSLAQLYESIGDTTRAVARYERVLELAPGNAAATARLEALRGGGGGR
ncbi:MAG: c-type cytochrome [Gemmatimonadetes bacterium]|nr:c-type cytochrome [Gemmatimonadota bacterium]NNK62374.1 c-type cytochrome [Gemmatimonadota bacterium]